MVGLKKIMSIWLLQGGVLCAQVSIDRQVINSAGASGNAGANFLIDYNIGETVIPTGTTANNFYTMGFLQPDTVLSVSGIFSVNINSGNESCQNASDGFIIATPFNASGPVSYLWQPTGDTTSKLLGLSAGTFVLTVSDTAGNSITDTLVILASSAACELEFFNGVTPNNDGKNDVFYISNIEGYPDNSLYIFNRYGTQVWEGTNYDNVNVVFSGKDKNGIDLPSATYFFVLVTGEKQKKGWLEILR
jgi:gliding motility-associated-like protein